MKHPSLRNLVSPDSDDGGADVPAEFRAALSALADVHHRPEITLQRTPAPARLAPYSVAMAARIDLPDVDDAGEDADVELATARFIVLHDPEGHEAWRGTTRVVVYLSTAVDEERADDARLSPEAWTWLTDALTEGGVAHHNLGGTVTRTVSDRFGDLAEPVPVVDMEMRASWTAEDTDLDRHLSAWLDVFARAAGLADPA